MPTRCLEDAEITQLLADLPHWCCQAVEICRTFQFSSFVQSINFVNQVAKLSEDAHHHPYISICWRSVTLRLSTHSVKGLTPLDFDLASKIDRLFESSKSF